MASSSSSYHQNVEEAPFSEFVMEAFPQYDAFINHRGPDVKETLALALHESLEEQDCPTFLDDQELKLGDPINPVIINAIRSSTVQIAIFSPRYAESSLCLDELVLMLRTKARFIPVFCDVEPSDLRHPENGVYATALARHKEKARFSNDRLHRWKAALHASSLVTGYIFSTSDDDVERLCTTIALAVQQEVEKTRSKEVVKPSIPAPVKKSGLLPRDSHPVGIDSKLEQIVGLLEDPKVKVIAVVGMAGSGKTFLLQNIYNRKKSRFEDSIWLSISRSYSVKNLQHDIASHLDLKSEIVDAAVTEERAAELIHRRLQGKKSLVVLDDLWTLSTEDYLFDKLGLPADKDCKVVVSTRDKQVALNSNAHIYKMKILSDEESWALFCAYAFPESEGNRAPPHMEEEGRKIVKQCGNLPLAIKTTAASLAKTRLLSKWESKRRQIERVVTPLGDPNPVMEILKLSYDSLPAHLKPCFAYLSFFPEDEEIDCEYLINLWIGERFIPADEDQWEIAWNWLDQLDNLCLIQLWEDVEHVNFKKRVTKSCKIHDLLHDLAIQISRENKCAFSVKEACQGISGGCCRILLAKKDVKDLSPLSQRRPFYLRTLSLSKNKKIQSIPANLFTAMRGLRILDLSCTSIRSLPASIENLRLLRVLNLRKTWIEEVPECVRHLKNLLFLAFPWSCRALPVWINELKSLQHLECTRVDCIPKGISKVFSLRTLRSFWLELSIEEDEFMRLEDFRKMTQLQEVSLTINHEMELKRLEEGILSQLVKMRRLGIQNGNRELAYFPETMSAMKHLEILRLEKFAVPVWICGLVNLRELMLLWCECSDYPELQGMPNLEKLVLTEGNSVNNNRRCRQFPRAFGKSGAFPRLRSFQIKYFEKLEKFPNLEEEAMACLEEFYLVGCPRVKKMGEGWERLKSLKRFNYLLSGTNELTETLRKGGEYWDKIKTMNPQLTISC
ncbi:hypothetical protein SUGI_0245800 [Cryptomeria japonica]|uniref:probable disease resistance protein At1g61300 n=1 Tax=Cryptomeria japonica TaxID=3369 RepID=UPI002408A059|nr:probable disease resistance protein At1g61300 [Cryptomeria japonica]GLJ15046.1 hypothetical protein SUGI_0245800 [Cryptomeria japonica]